MTVNLKTGFLYETHSSRSYTLKPIFLKYQNFNISNELGRGKLWQAEHNYDDASAILEEAYNNYRNLISRHLNSLLTLPSQFNESTQGLMALRDEAKQYFKFLANLRVIVITQNVVQTIENQLDKITM